PCARCGINMGEGRYGHRRLRGVVGLGSTTDSAAFRQTEEVVGLLAVVLGLLVLVTESTGGGDHVDGSTAPADVEGQLAALDAGDGILLGDLPGRPVAVTSSNVGNPLVRVGSVGLANAQHFMTARHCKALPWNEC